LPHQPRAMTDRFLAPALFRPPTCPRPPPQRPQVEVLEV